MLRSLLLPLILLSFFLFATLINPTLHSLTIFSDVKKKNGSDDGSEDAPPSPQKPIKGATKQTWGAKSKGTVMCAFCYCCSILLICSCLVDLLFFLLFTHPFTLDLIIPHHM